MSHVIVGGRKDFSLLHTRALSHSLLLAGLLSAAAASKDSPSVVIDSSGTTLTPFPVFGAKKQIVIEIRGSDASTRFHYKFYKVEDGSCVAGADDGPTLLPDSGLFKLTTKDHTTDSCIPYTISNDVSELKGITGIQEETLVQSPGVFRRGGSAPANYLSRLLTIEATNKTIQDRKAAATIETDAAKVILDELTPQLEALNARMQLFATAQAVDELNALAPQLADLQTRIAAARQRQTTIKAALDRSVADLEKQISAAKPSCRAYRRPSPSRPRPNSSPC